MAQLIDIKNDFDLGNRFLLDVAEQLASSLSDEFRVIVKYDSQDYNFSDDGKKNIIFSLGRETHDTPRYVDDDRVFAMFHNYAKLDKWGHPVQHEKVIPLPLGTFISDIESKSEEVIPFRKRKYDFCFVGQIPHTGTRDKFKRNLDKLLEEKPDKFKHYVKFTKNFGSGLDHDEYIELLNNSKLCLCPQGAFSEESFRFFESIKVGAIPVVERVPKFWYYQKSPIMFARWEFIDSYLSKIFNFLNSNESKLVFEGVEMYNQTVLDTEWLSGFFKYKIEEKEKHVSATKLQNTL
jgi:hypothetical protein